MNGSLINKSYGIINYKVAMAAFNEPSVCPSFRRRDNSRSEQSKHFQFHFKVLT